MPAELPAYAGTSPSRPANWAISILLWRTCARVRESDAQAAYLDAAGPGNHMEPR
jgi:hypothetical protein